eukprot:1090527-Alexandrium_andersonii.AAC.1
MAWGRGGELYLRAAQARSHGVASRLDMSRALEPYAPAHESWCPVGLHGTKEEYVEAILCEGLSTRHSAGGKLGEKREHIHM